MTEQLVPESRTRSRERSKTPFHLRSQCDGENCNEEGHVHIPKKKSPTVTTITEEPESTTVSATKNLIYSESSNGASKTSHQASTSTAKSTSTVPFTNTKSSHSSQRTILKTKRVLSRGTELKDNILNAAQEELFGDKYSTPKQNSPNGSKVSPTILENLNLNDHLAYKEYKEAGEYWKKYPKTDYVYSSTYSPFRREIKPGVIAMPNMSRRSLDHHQERVNEMASRNSAQESYIRSRYLATYEKFQNSNLSDHSQDEFDEFDYVPTAKKSSIIRRFFTAIIAILVTIFNKTCGIFVNDRNYRKDRYGRAHASKGLVSTLTSTVQSVGSSIYIIIASIQYCDSCLLQSPNAENQGRKRFLILLLLLLPFLALAGLFNHHGRLPAASVSTGALLDYLNAYADLDNVRDITYNQYGNAKNISLDFLLYLKELSSNYVQEIRSVWTEKFST